MAGGTMGLWLAAACLLAGEAGAVTLHVAPGGSDAADGTAQRPLATPVGARDALRRRRTAGEQGPASIVFHGGVYPLTAPLTLGPQDGGSAAAPVTWQAAPGEQPVFSGGRRITGWQAGADGVWTAEVPAARTDEGFFHQLWVNGRRAARACEPAEGYFRIAGQAPEVTADKKDVPEAHLGFRFKPGDIDPRADLKGTTLTLYHSWTNSVHWIDHVEAAQNVVRLTNRSGYAVGQWDREQRYRLENVKSGLRQPGSWYLSETEGRLYYRPLPGETLATADVVAPVATMLLKITGEAAAGLPASNLTFRGLAFWHTDWHYPRSQSLDGQAATFLDGVIHASGIRNCVFEDLDVGRGGSYGIWLAPGCKDNVIRHCRIHDLAGGGVRIGDGQTRLGEDLAERNTLDNCFLHHLGIVFNGACGVLVQRASFNRVTHNEISDLNYTGVSVGWSWGYEATSAHDNLVEFNHVHHLGWGVMSDMGGIYTLGISPGTRIANNVFHDILSYSYGGWGLYTDEGSTGIVLENNLVYNTKTGGFHQHYGRENVVRNNILAFSAEGQVQRTRVEDHVSFTMDHNLVYFDQGSLLSGNWAGDQYKLHDNLYFNPREDVEFGGLTLAEWQAKGQDKGSVVADPLFVNAAARDFRLKPASPALKMGFKEFDTSTVGLYGDDAWVAQPKAIQRPVMVFAKPEPPKPIADDFESTPVGELPVGPVVSGETDQARVRVTDEQAAAGKHSLKITDAPGLKHSWDPHFFWRPGYRKGVLTASFDLRVGDGARLYHEWRSEGGVYKTGPSLTIEPSGRLTASGVELLTIPHNQWIHFEIVFELGPHASGKYRVSVTLPGAAPRVFESLAAKDKLPNLSWLGFSSESTDTRVFYLDNFRLSPPS